MQTKTKTESGNSGSSKRWPTIRKDPATDARDANLDDYESVRRSFTWADARAGLGGLPGGGLNIAYEAVDRHLAQGKAEKVALRWLGRDGTVRDITYRELAEQSNRFANVLASLGVGKGDRVYSLLGRVPDLYVAALGTLKNGSVYSPMFSAFGPEPIKARMSIGDAKVLVTTESFYKRKVAAWRDELETLEHVLLIDRKDDALASTTTCLADAMADASPDFEMIRTEPEDMALLHFTSGTTGRPKGAIHVHEAAVAHHATGRFALDLHEDDIFWCTADPGWVTGTSYGIVAPLTAGVTMIVDQADFDSERWYEILRDQKVSVWYTAPTAIRMLMKLGGAAVGKRDLPQLRFIASVGEPLNPEAVLWGVDAFGLPIHDNWWQTETGGIMIANYRSMDVKPGSMGRPLPGIEAAIVRRTNGGVDVVAAANTVGELALKTGWPSMMRGYLHEDERYRKCFAGEWYLTGDLAMQDEDGYFWFVGRDDDVIKSSGHLIGPFEVESALMEHAAVAEAAVIGKPDPTAGELVKAFVALHDGFEASDALRRELLGHARKRLGSAVAPKEIDFRANLPKTRSGKIMRRLLKARELGLPEGDLSTLESDER